MPEDVEECLSVIKILQDALYANEVLREERRSTVPRQGIVTQVKEDMDRLIERYGGCDGTAQRSVVSLARVCKTVVGIEDDEERKKAAIDFIDMCDAARAVNQAENSRE